ncbi:unnamed protein product [Haemonchus placei]|uniref:Ovule protein n=1 Tax=Haemonchus placei TaxID=6290 RepID=A0A158QLB0_HAEPC|nr:unnamed protein product [Haemonchus placei]
MAKLLPTQGLFFKYFQGLGQEFMGILLNIRTEIRVRTKFFPSRRSQCFKNRDLCSRSVFVIQNSVWRNKILQHIVESLHKLGTFISLLLALVYHLHAVVERKD